MHEKWKTIDNYELYDVSNLGRIRSWNNNSGNGTGRRIAPRVLRLGVCPGGYPQVSLCVSGTTKKLSVHRLVLEAFVGPCPAGMECCHNDGSRANNHLGNLRWDTRSANRQDAITHGTWVAPKADNRGEANGQAKLTKADVIRIRAIYATGKITQRELGKQFGVGQSQVSCIVNGQKWAHIQSITADFVEATNA